MGGSRDLLHGRMESPLIPLETISLTCFSVRYSDRSIHLSIKNRFGEASRGAGTEVCDRILDRLWVRFSIKKMK